MKQTTSPFPISRPHSVDGLPPEGKDVAIEAEADERAALAAFLGVPAVRDFRARLLLRPWRRIGVAVTGTVAAAIEQECVVTLDPVTQEVTEEIDVRLLPDDAAGAEGGSGEVDIDPLGEDPPDRFRGRTVDLGAIAVEHMALGIDPYPRAPGVEFDESAYVSDTDDGGAPRSPFAALAALRKSDDQR